MRRAPGLAEPLAPPRGDFNPALGIFPHANYHGYERALADGDVVLFYTDGLFEVEDASGRQLGVEGLVNCVQSLTTQPLDMLFNGVLAAVQSYAVRGFDDDVCLLAVGLAAARGS